MIPQDHSNLQRVITVSISIDSKVVVRKVMGSHTVYPRQESTQRTATRDCPKLAPSSLISTLDEGGQRHPCRFTPEEGGSGGHWIGDRVGSRAGLEAMKANLLSLPGIKRWSSTSWLRYTGSSNTQKMSEYKRQRHFEISFMSHNHVTKNRLITWLFFSIGVKLIKRFGNIVYFLE